ncbi:MAG TPA: LLM class flavin-dependent oxidoreductase [Candidatus Dormibacteraeota bacterium]|nr:LLM class flavin-dependent oxidoreductase [Candidatus Dormibacteraeota bacterium]
MKFGVGDFSGQRPPGSPVTHEQLYAEMLDQADQIEAAGLDSMWVSEHHFAQDGYMASVLPIVAALLARTRRITVAADRLATSLYDPVRLAEDAIALDLLSGGRFVLGLSLCYRDDEFAGLGVERATDEVRLEETARLLRDAFSSRPVRGALVTPPPATDGGPRLMIAADGERAARLADMVMVDPTEPWAVVDAAVEKYDAARGHHDGELVFFAYGGLSADGPEAAWVEVAEGFRYMRHNYDRWMHKPETEVLPPADYRLLLGAPEEVAVQAAEYRRRYGDRVHLVLRCNYPGMTAAAVSKQIRLWGDVAKRIARTN